MTAVAEASAAEINQASSNAAKLYQSSRYDFNAMKLK